MKYTEKIHAKRLLGMLNKNNPCLCCPQERRYGILAEGKAWEDYSNMPWQEDLHNVDNACYICLEFLNIKQDGSEWCPCLILGEKEAIKRTWLALEEKGYI